MRSLGLTLALMYCTDFFDQLEHRIVPALQSGAVVLADRYIFTLIARSVVRGINRDYLSGFTRWRCGRTLHSG